MCDNKRAGQEDEQRSGGIPPEVLHRRRLDMKKSGRRCLNQKDSFSIGKYWHGAVQFLTCAVFLILSWVVFHFMEQWRLIAADIPLILATGLAISIAVICSHAYNYTPGGEKMGELYDQAARQKAVWLHANFSWQVVSIWMTVTPLYCTCAAIYISGTPINGTWDHTHVLIYSILSLVISLGVYVIRPSNRAEGYRRAYQTVNEALLQYEPAEGRASALANAIIEGERFITEQDVKDPK